MKLLNDYLRETFGCKVYKLALNGGFTCPNRDGTLGTGGCIFCSAGGSGEFAEDAGKSITQQIEDGKGKILSDHLRFSCLFVRYSSELAFPLYSLASADRSDFKPFADVCAFFRPWVNSIPS